MTNETNAALSALRAIRGEHDLWQCLNEPMVQIVDEAIALLEASQREAPVAEGEIQRWELVADWDRDRMGKTEAWVRDFKNPAGKWVLFEDVARRLADRPSVTNVSRERIQGVVERFGGPIYGTTEKITDTLFSLQFQSVAPAPGKAADEVTQ